MELPSITGSPFLLPKFTMTGHLLARQRELRSAMRQAINARTSGLLVESEGVAGSCINERTNQYIEEPQTGTRIAIAQSI